LTCTGGTDACGGTCAADEVCDEGAAACVATDIPDGTVDIGGDCLVDADCLPGDACDATTGLCIAGEGGGACADDADCASDETCDTATGACVVASSGCSVSSTHASTGGAGAGLLALALVGLIGMARRRNRR
jgi:MYXO-CTERM domain-containing protein